MPSLRKKFLRSSLRCLVCLVFIFGIESAWVVSPAVSHYDGSCFHFLEGYSPCSFDESLRDQMLLPYSLNWFLISIPCFFWGISTGRVIALSLTLPRMFSIIMMLAYAIAGVRIGIWLSNAWMEILLAVVRMMNISPKHG
jgi:hypothetical protein